LQAGSATKQWGLPISALVSISARQTEACKYWVLHGCVLKRQATGIEVPFKLASYVFFLSQYLPVVFASSVVKRTRV
jgi:hypothetical protein